MPKGFYVPLRSIMWAMVLGITVGVILRNLEGVLPESIIIIATSLFDVIGSLFLAGLKVLVVPLVFVSLVCGVGSLADLSRVGRIGGTAISLYLATTALAVTAALGLGMVWKPGSGINLHSAVAVQVAEPPSLSEIVIGLIPTNPVEAMARGEMLQVIFLALLTGLALTSLPEQSKRQILQGFELANHLVMKMVELIIRVSPYGIFGLLGKVFIEQGIGVVGSLFSYFVLVLLALTLHVVLVYGTLLSLAAKRKPREFFASVRPALACAFGTASSNATLPVSYEVATKGLGVDEGIASFTLPLGATINMDGTAIMQGLATAFIAQAYGLELSTLDLVTVVSTATLASIGTAGVPGVGLIMLAMVLKQVGLPVEGIGLILGVDRLLDMARTAVNVTGDLVVTSVIDRLEGVRS